MPERFESNVFDPATTALMKSALEAAMLKRKTSRADEQETRTLLASAIIDQVNAGETRSPKNRRPSPCDFGDLSKYLALERVR